jgi:hypothetical protein
VQRLILRVPSEVEDKIDDFAARKDRASFFDTRV